MAAGEGAAAVKDKRYCPHCNRWLPADQVKQRRNGKVARCDECNAKRKKPERAK